MDKISNLKREIINILDSNKALDIVTIDLEGKSSMADYMIVASGRSPRQVNAAAERVRRLIKKENGLIPSLEGQPRCDWVLIDANEIVVHIFQPEVRKFYNLEKMWSANLILESENEGTETIL